MQDVLFNCPYFIFCKVLLEMNRHYHTCLDTCHRLQQLHSSLQSITMATSIAMADKLMYNSAIQMVRFQANLLSKQSFVILFLVTELLSLQRFYCKQFELYNNNIAAIG